MRVSVLIVDNLTTRRSTGKTGQDRSNGRGRPIKYASDGYNAAAALSNPFLAPFFSRLIPVCVERRKPLITLRRQGAMTLDRALELAERFPEARCGIRTGFKRCYDDGLRLAVFDADRLRYLVNRDLLPEHLLDGGSRVRTPRGMHTYVEDCRKVGKGRRWKLPDGHIADLITSVNAFVFAPGTVRPDGQLYLPLSGFGDLTTTPLARLEDGDLDALDAVCRRNRRGRGRVSFPAVYPENGNGNAAHVGGPALPTSADLPALDLDIEGLPAHVNGNGRPAGPAGTPAGADAGDDLRRKWLGARADGPNRYFWGAAGDGKRRDTLNRVLVATPQWDRNHGRTLAETIEWAEYVNSSFDPPRPAVKVVGDAKSAYSYVRQQIDSGESAAWFSETQRERIGRRYARRNGQDQSENIRVLLARGESQTAIARSLDVSISRVHRIANQTGRTARETTAARNAAIRSARAEGRSERAIAAAFKLSRNAIRNVLAGPESGPRLDGVTNLIPDARVRTWTLRDGQLRACRTWTLRDGQLRACRTWTLRDGQLRACRTWTLRDGQLRACRGMASPADPRRSGPIPN